MAHLFLTDAPYVCRSEFSANARDEDSKPGGPAIVLCAKWLVKTHESS